MERLIEIIETKYGWAEVALNEGVETLEVTEYLAQQLFKKAA